MKKAILYFLIFAFLPLTILAQETREIKEPGKIIFNKHGYLQLQGGAAYTLGESKFKDLISPAAAVNFGYNFSPVLGLRLGASGWQAKGAWVSPAQLYKFNYAQANADLVFDLANLFGSFNPVRAVSPYLFLGIGGAYAFNNDEAEKLNTGDYKLEYLWKDNKFFPMARGGIGFNFRLSNALSLTLEGNVNMTNDHFNSKKADQPDWQFNALAGIKINLGKTYKKIEPVYYEPIPVEPEPAPVVEPTPEPEPEPVTVVVEEKKFPELPTVHFVRGSAHIDVKKYATELATIVSVLNEFGNQSVELIGFCDHTGSETLNDDLSERRAEALKAYLMKQGIDGVRLTTKGMGKDMSITGEEAYSVKARRVEVTK